MKRVLMRNWLYYLGLLTGAGIVFVISLFTGKAEWWLILVIPAVALFFDVIGYTVGRARALKAYHRARRSSLGAVKPE